MGDPSVTEAAAAPPPASPPASAGVLLAASGLSVAFGGEPVLDSIDIAVGEGQIVTLIGPNGSGKTTLVRAMLGLIEPDSGSVNRRPGLTIGYVPQRLAIDPTLPLTVGRFLTLNRRAGRARLLAALDAVGAGAVIDRPVQRVSGGEFQRVLLARALLCEPDLLVLDEPSQGVDVAGQAELYDLIIGLRGGLGCAVLLVSHDLHLVMSATDTVVCLNRHVCCTGRPETITREPAYLELFGPRAADALAVYTHHHDHHHGPGGEVVADTAPDG